MGVPEDWPLDPALARRQQPNALTERWTLYFGKVIAVHPDRGTVDVALDGAGPGGGFYLDCAVGMPYAGSQTGLSYLPTVTLTTPIPGPDGTWDLATASGDRDVYCVVGHLRGLARQPVVLQWFVLPEGSQMLFETPGIRVDRHESGVYRVTLPTAGQHDEIHWPDGTYLLVGANTTPHPMTTENPAWNPPTASAGSWTLHHASGASVQIAPDGTITVNAASGQDLVLNGGTAAVARVGDAVQVSVSGTVYSGTITSGSATVKAG